MADRSDRIRRTRAENIAFVTDPERTNPAWAWSPGLAVALDVDEAADPASQWRAQARDQGESWQTRSAEVCRAVLMKSQRQKHPLVRTLVWLTLPARRGLLEQGISVLAVREEGTWYAWTSEEDLISPKPSNTSPSPGG